LALEAGLRVAAVLRGEPACDAARAGEGRAALGRVLCEELACEVFGASLFLSAGLFERLDLEGGSVDFGTHLPFQNIFSIL
jgi:hypothetical protein